jgi:hypothetical protein
LMSKKEVENEQLEDKDKKMEIVSKAIVDLRSVSLMQGYPALIDVSRFEETEEFQLKYKCKHCGHEWTEEQITTRDEAVKGDYKGD